MPGYAHITDAAMDLYADEVVYIYPGHRTVVSTGICMEVPNGHVGLIRPKSGLAVKHGLDVMAGVIDSGYRGEILVVLINHGDNPNFRIDKGSKIAQMLIIPVIQPELEIVDSLSSSDRGNNGFGSTGT